MEKMGVNECLLAAGGLIHVTSASWVALLNLGELDCTDIVRSVCNGRATCSITPTNLFCGGDPRPFLIKTLKVNYHCGFELATEAKTINIREGTEGTLAC